MNRTGKVLGSIFIILGALFLLRNLNIIGPIWQYVNIGRIIGTFWPSLFLILPGLLFHLGYLSGRKKDPGVLVPGGILLVLGAAFQVNMLFGGWEITWPIYIFSVAFGLFELYVFGNRDRGLLIPIGILTGLSAIFFFVFSVKTLLGINTQSFIVPAVLIGIGLIVLFGGKGNGGRQKF
jgi:hypothetical protein